MLRVYPPFLDPTLELLIVILRVKKSTAIELDIFTGSATNGRLERAVCSFRCALTAASSCSSWRIYRTAVRAKSRSFCSGSVLEEAAVGEDGAALEV